MLLSTFYLIQCIVSEAHIEKPNIVIMLADDLGYGDIGAYGHPTSTTPNLDMLAREGLLFTQFYTASPVCSPSRAALLTGRLQTRTGVWPYVFRTPSIGGLPHNETTIAEILKNEGYKTSIIGKWHLGVGENGMYLPKYQGFDYYLGIPYSHDMCPCEICFYPRGHCASSCEETMTPCPLYENEEIIQQPVDLTELTDKYSNAATGFIKANAGKVPFFLYMAFQHTHKPQFSGKRFINSSIRGMFGDSLNELDWQVGEIMKALDSAGVSNNTFVFFTADNGPYLHMGPHGGNGGPLRCGKGTTWEGGQREAAIAWWPNKIKAGRTAELSATVDILPTICSITGTKEPDVVLDGMDMSPMLFEEKPSKRDYYIYYPKDPNPKVGIFAIRWKQYKAHFYQQGSHCQNTYPDIVCRGNYTMRKNDPPMLFNLEEDPSEFYPLNNSQYASTMSQILKLKSWFESEMIWGESQMDRGTNSSLMPCASPGCSPFPSCCQTPSQMWRKDLWIETSSTKV